MPTTGTVVAVETTNAGTLLVADAGVGADTLLVETVGRFALDGGSVLLTDYTVDGDPITQTIDYLSAEEDTNTINLDGVLTEDFTDGSTVDAIPLSPTTRAYVSTDDYDEPLPCVVTQELRAAYAVALADGNRDGDGVTVTADQVGGVWTVITVIGVPAQLDGGSVVGELPPGSIPPVPPPTEAPTDAPVLTLSPFAIGAVRPTWTAVDGAQWYDVYASLTPGFDSDDPANRVATGIVDLETMVSMVGGVQLPVDGTPVYVVVKAVNVVGDGPASNEESAIARQADAEFISALMGMFDTVEGQTAIFGTLKVLMQLEASGSFSVGSRIIISTPTNIDGVLAGGIEIFADDAHTQLAARLHPDGNYLNGILVAQEITVIQALRLIGDASAIASGAKVKIENGIADPAAPTVTYGTTLRNWAPIPAGFSERGITWDSYGNQWLQLLFSTSAGRAYIRYINADGEVEPGDFIELERPEVSGTPYPTTWANGITVDPITGEIIIGARWNHPVAGNAWSDVRYTRSGAFVSFLFGTAAVSGKWSTPYTDGTDLWLTSNDSPGYVYITRCNGTNVSVRINTATVPDVAQSNSLRLLPSSHYGSLTDLWQIATYAGNVYHFKAVAATTGVPPTLVRDSQWDFITDTNALFAFKDDDGTTDEPEGFYSSKSDAKIAGYSGYYPAAGEKVYALTVDTGGGQHTAASPESAGVAIPKQRFAIVTLSPLPAGADDSDVYAGWNTSSGGTKRLRSETLAGRTMILTDGKITGADAWPTTNTMSGAPGEIWDDFGNRWPGTGALELPGFQKSGVQVLPLAAVANTTYTYDIEFDDPFPVGTDIAVTFGIRTSSPMDRHVGYQNPTNEGFTITYATASTVSAMQVSWSATPVTQ